MNARGSYWYDKNWLRAGALICLALAAIQLISTYIQKLQQPLPDTPTYHVISSGSVEPGKHASLRISARLMDSKDVAPVQVEDISVEGHPVHFTTSGSGPTMVQVDVPHTIAERTNLELTVRSEKGPPRLVALPVTVARPTPNFSAVPEEDSLSRIQAPFRVDVLPNELVMGMNNTVYVFVRRKDGSPASDVTVDIAYSGGKIRGQTTPWGLFEFQLADPQPAFECRIRINENEYESTESLRAYGKGIQLTPRASHVATGHPSRVAIRTRAESSTLYCDLRRGSVWRQSWTTKTRLHQGELELPGLEDGLYHLQCTSHDLKSGEAVATTPIVASRESAHVALRSLLTENEVWYKTSLPETSAGAASNEQTHRFWLESLKEPPFGGDLPSVFTTEEDKKARRDARKDELASFIPFVLLLLLLVVIWITEINLRRKAESRAQYDAFAAEDSLSELGIEADASQLTLLPYLRSRAILFGTVILGSIALNGLLFDHSTKILG